MIRRILKGAATVASLPVWIVGNALMVPLLKRQLRRETAKVQSLTVDLGEWKTEAAERKAEAESWYAQSAEHGRRLTEAEGQLEALRSAAREIADSLEWPTAEWAETCMVAARMLKAALGGTPPVQDAPPTMEKSDSGPAQCCHCGAIYAPASGHACPVATLAKEALKEFAGKRPPVEGDHPADPVTQQWAGAMEHITRERDRWRGKCETRQIALAEAQRDRDALRREVDTLRRELAEADRVHDGVVAELKARHREVLAERDQTIARLRGGQK